MSTAEQYSLRWNNFHSNMTSGFHDLFEALDMVDVTLAIEGQFLQAHKLVLSICSPYFKEMFKVNPCKHPIVILKDISHDHMKDILHFMYHGEVNILMENLNSFLKTAELLQVKGLTGDDSSDTSSRKDEKAESICENEEEPDLQNFSDIIEKDQPVMPQYSTPVAPQLPKQSSNSIKRGKQSPQHTNTKRPKSDYNSNQASNSPVKNEMNSTANSSEMEDYEEYAGVSVDSIKLETEEQSKDIQNQSVDVQASGVIPPGGDSNSQDQDLLLYMVDEEGHVHCPYCYKKFVNRYNLKVHIRDKHVSTTNNFDCRICGKTMRNRSCLRVHMYHHRKQEMLKAEALWKEECK